MRSSARRHDYQDLEEEAHRMRYVCPACDIPYETEHQDRLIQFGRDWYNVCPACYIAYLKVRVTKGEHLTMADLLKIGRVRKKFTSTS